VGFNNNGIIIIIVLIIPIIVVILIWLYDGIINRYNITGWFLSLQYPSEKYGLVKGSWDDDIPN